MTNKTTKSRSRQDVRQRSIELQEFAQIAYEQVPTQQEMLGCELAEACESVPSPKADPKMTKVIDEYLYEAAQEGNIGGG